MMTQWTVFHFLLTPAMNMAAKMTNITKKHLVNVISHTATILFVALVCLPSISFGKKPFSPAESFTRSNTMTMPFIEIENNVDQSKKYFNVMTSHGSVSVNLLPPGSCGDGKTVKGVLGESPLWALSSTTNIVNDCIGIPAIPSHPEMPYFDKTVRKKRVLDFGFLFDADGFARS